MFIHIVKCDKKKMIYEIAEHQKKLRNISAAPKSETMQKLWSQTIVRHTTRLTSRRRKKLQFFQHLINPRKARQAAPSLGENSRYTPQHQLMLLRVSHFFFFFIHSSTGSSTYFILCHWSRVDYISLQSQTISFNPNMIQYLKQDRQRHLWVETLDTRPCTS